jgi:hypothetical protein
MALLCSTDLWGKPDRTQHLSTHLLCAERKQGGRSSTGINMNAATRAGCLEITCNRTRLQDRSEVCAAMAGQVWHSPKLAGLLAHGPAQGFKPMTQPCRNPARCRLMTCLGSNSPVQTAPWHKKTAALLHCGAEQQDSDWLVVRMHTCMVQTEPIPTERLGRHTCIVQYSHGQEKGCALWHCVGQPGPCAAICSTHADHPAGRAVQHKQPCNNLHRTLQDNANTGRCPMQASILHASCTKSCAHRLYVTHMGALPLQPPHKPTSTLCFMPMQGLGRRAPGCIISTHVLSICACCMHMPTRVP